MSDVYREIGLNFCSAAADLIADDEYMQKAPQNSPHAYVRNEISQQGMNGRLKITLPFGSVIYAKKDGSRRIESLRQTSAQLGSATYVCGYRRVEEPEVGPSLRLISFRVGEQHQYVFLWKECSNVFEFEIVHGRDTVLREDTFENKVLGLSSAGKQSVIWADL
ncbi:hypothetical protein AB1A64_15530 [Ruegeria sp. ANG10]|uniref:hypothetical protein n=1 Tax=Ruegeria sp. ANG10 TaxID=3042467 RepID=UPI003455DDE1